MKLRMQGRDGTKLKKKDTRRSSSNESSSSESDSSSSRSTGSSSSSFVEKRTLLSQPHTGESLSLHVIEVSKGQEKNSPPQMEMTESAPLNKASVSQLNQAPIQDDSQGRHGSDHEKEKPERSQGEHAVSVPEKGAEGNNETPKAFSTRKISLSSSKSSPGSTENEHELGSAGGRKRRWGSSTAVTAKKPSISITTDSLKSLIPDIKPALNQEIMDLDAEDPVLSETDDEDKDHADQDLQICRTVTQIVNVENKENGEKETKGLEELEEDVQDETETKTYDEDPTLQAIQAHSPLCTPHEEVNTVTPRDNNIRRSISQQKMGVSITIDDPVRTARQPSPPRGDVSNIVHVCNLVRPFTLGQLKELLSRTGTLVEDGFWIDKIKSHCYVTYSTSEEAVATRQALHGVKWPQSNPKVLRVDFCQQDELDFHKGLNSAEGPRVGVFSHGQSLHPLLPVRDQWAEREREMGRREQARADREWDRDKIREFGKTPEEREAGAHRSRSRERRRKDREKSKEMKAEKKDKTEDPPAKMLDDLFRKTKAVPCIYWLPLTEEQYLQRETARIERRKEREQQRKREEEEAELKKKEENKERMRAGGGITVDRSEADKDKIRDRERARDRGRERDREADKRKEGYRRPGGYAPPSGRRSRSRSDPRERRR
uniref:RRM domain-containing protein n=1 Tax=Knipowitschia caucasica TaxID=637954 RepID=A0AAV2JU41_KNICA